MVMLYWIMSNLAATSSDLSESTAHWEFLIQTWINYRDLTILHCLREDNLQTSLPVNVLPNINQGPKTPIVFLHILPRPVASNARLFTFWYWSPTCTRWPNVSPLKCPLTDWEAMQLSIVIAHCYQCFIDIIDLKLNYQYHRYSSKFIGMKLYAAKSVVNPAMPLLQSDTPVSAI